MQPEKCSLEHYVDFLIVSQRQFSAVELNKVSLAEMAHDRGNLIPCQDCCWSEVSMLESFFLSNMSPQIGEFNGGKWRSLEDKVRDWAQCEGSVFVVTGLVLTDSLQN